jgi:hypothetical protein
MAGAAAFRVPPMPLGLINDLVDRLDGVRPSLIAI